MKKCLLGWMLGSCMALNVFAEPLGYAVASEHPLATRAGLEILAQGGNAFDAAIAVSAVLAVVAPYHSGLGGGGFFLLQEGKTGKYSFIDARETAPLAAHKDMFLNKQGEVVAGLSLNGGLAAAIPGEPAALVYLATHYGRLPLRTTLAPAIALAQTGFPVDEAFHDFSTMGDRGQQLARFPGSRAVFLKQGKSWRLGERLLQPELAKTLQLLAEKGHAGFYEGKIAALLVEGVHKAGGVWTRDDLARYRVKLRTPLEGKYHDMRIVTAPLPSAGGIALLTMLNILAQKSLDLPFTLQWVHDVTEAMRMAFWQRGQGLGDPDFISTPVVSRISEEHAKTLLRLTAPRQATSNGSLLPQGTQLSENLHTTHLVVLDKEGNRVAATLSVNYIFGSSVVAEGTGVLLNDTMDDFSIKSGVPNVFGLPGSRANAIEAGKRPLSSMTPTFLDTPTRAAMLGSPGGSRIPGMVLLATLAFSESGGAIDMVSRMRFHHQHLPDVLQFEPDTFSPALQKALKGMGYTLMALKQYYGNMQAITWDKTSNFITATSDPRHPGLAVTVQPQTRNYGVGF